MHTKPLVRKLVSGFTTVILLLISTATSYATADQEQFTLPMKSSGGWIGMDFSETVENNQPGALKVDNSQAVAEEAKDSYLCATAQDIECTRDGYRMRYKSVFTLCESAADLDCIASITAKKGDAQSSKVHLNDIGKMEIHFQPIRLGKFQKVLMHLLGLFPA